MTLLHLSADEMRELLEGHRIEATVDEGYELSVTCEAADDPDPTTHLEIITRAALSFLHGDDWNQTDLAKLADTLGVDHGDVEALADFSAERTLFHRARPGAGEFHCGVCGQTIQRVPGGQGPTYIHVDSGAVAALNPPGRKQA